MPTKVILHFQPFQEDFHATEVIGRKELQQELAACLEPALHGRPPLHCWMSGPPGSGKTWVCQALLSALGKKGLRYVYVPCTTSSTFYTVLSQINQQLRLLCSEKTIAANLEKFQQFQRGHAFLIVLDMIDLPAPKAREEILAHLASLPAVGLLCLSNGEEELLYDLHERVRSRLAPVLVAVPPYAPEELVALLKPRATQALTSRSWSVSLLQRIAQLSQGDARVALHTLRYAAEFAEREGEPIQPHHVQRGFSQVRHLKATHRLKNLTPHHRLLYELIEARPAVISRDLLAAYQQACRKRSLRPVARRTWTSYLQKLQDLQLIQGKRAPLRGRIRCFRIGPASSQPSPNGKERPENLRPASRRTEGAA